MLEPMSDEETDNANVRFLRSRRLGVPPDQVEIRRRGKRREEPSRVEIVSDGGNDGGKEGPLAPHARFFIEREKSLVSVSFEPPV